MFDGLWKMENVRTGKNKKREHFFLISCTSGLFKYQLLALVFPVFLRETKTKYLHRVPQTCLPSRQGRHRVLRREKLFLIKKYFL